MTDTPPGDVTELEEIVVIGTRPQPGTPIDPNEHQDEVDPNPDEPGTGGGGLWTQPAVDAENERQKQCAAKKFEDDLADEDEKDDKEFFSLSWILNGQTVTHAIRGGTGPVISQGQLDGAMAEFGIDGGDIAGFAHNHPSNHYCPSSGALGFDEERLNAYPSDNDWGAAGYLVSLGANEDTLSLFVVGCDDELREFKYKDEDEIKQSAGRRDLPPPPIAPQGCPE